MTTDNNYSKVLLELKTKYEQTLAELEAHTNQIKARLTSLDTLIEDPLLSSDLLSILQGDADSLASKAPDATSKETVKTKAEAKTKKTTQKASPTSGKRKSPASKKSASAQKTTKKVELKAEATPKKADQKASLTSSKKKSSTPKKATPQTKKTQKKTKRSSTNMRPMLWPYTEMFKVDAIEKIVQENAGNPVHIDDLILKLYGKLSGDELKAERDRMYKTMYKGIQQDRWIKAPKQAMSYLIEESSQVKSEESKTAKSRKKT